MASAGVIGGVGKNRLAPSHLGVWDPDSCPGQSEGEEKVFVKLVSELTREESQTEGVSMGVEGVTTSEE